MYECVLKACVEAGDGKTALEIVHRQVAEPQQLLQLLQRLPVPSSPSSTAAFALGEGGAAVEVSGGPPDRRCWSLAAEALGRAGMIEEVRSRHVLQPGYLAVRCNADKIR